MSVFDVGFHGYHEPDLAITVFPSIVASSSTLIVMNFGLHCTVWLTPAQARILRGLLDALNLEEPTT